MVGVREAAVRACARTQQSALTTHSGNPAWWGPHKENKQPSYHRSALIKCLKLCCGSESISAFSKLGHQQGSPGEGPGFRR